MFFKSLEYSLCLSSGKQGWFVVHCLGLGLDRAICEHKKLTKAKQLLSVMYHVQSFLLRPR